jgi:hypothetical protein
VKLLLSVDIGLPRKVKFGSEFITTRIFKNPVDKRMKRIDSK